MSPFLPMKIKGSNGCQCEDSAYTFMDDDLFETGFLRSPAVHGPSPPGFAEQRNGQRRRLKCQSSTAISKQEQSVDTKPSVFLLFLEYSFYIIPNKKGKNGQGKPIKIFIIIINIHFN